MERDAANALLGDVPALHVDVDDAVAEPHTLDDDAAVTRPCIQPRDRPDTLGGEGQRAVEHLSACPIASRTRSGLITFGGCARPLAGHQISSVVAIVSPAMVCMAAVARVPAQLTVSSPAGGLR